MVKVPDTRSYLAQDFVAIVAIAATGILTYHGSVTAGSFEALVTLCLGFVFGRQATSGTQSVSGS